MRLLVIALLLLAACSPPAPAPAEDAGSEIVTPPQDAGAGGGTVQDAGVDAGSDAGTQPFDGGPFWANTQYPAWITTDAGGSTTVYGQVWIEGRTQQPGATAGLVAELGVGPAGTIPSDAGWSWTSATFNVDVGNNDEFQATLVAPAPGVYDYAFRYRVATNSPWPGWLLADRSDNGRKGTDDGYRSEDSGKLAVRASGAALDVATLNLHCLLDDPAARLDAAAARFTALGTEVVVLQEVCTGSPVTNSAEYLVGKLNASTGKSWRHLFVQTHLANNVTPEGLGIITSLPIAEVAVQDLATADFPRKALLALIATPAGVIGFASTHLSFASTTQAQQARLDAANALVALANSWRPRAAAFVVAGDFNAIPTDPPISAMTSGGFLDAWAARNGTATGYTHTSSNPTRRIDYVFARDLSVAECRVEFDQPYATGKYVSDHRGVSARLTAP